MELHIMYKTPHIDRIHQYLNHFYIAYRINENRYLCKCDCGDWIITSVQTVHRYTHRCRRKETYTFNRLYMQYIQNDKGVFYNVRVFKNNDLHDLGNYETYEQAKIAYDSAKEIYRMRDEECAERI